MTVSGIYTPSDNDVTAQVTDLSPIGFADAVKNMRRDHPRFYEFHCPWCGICRTELTGRCYCGRTPLQREALAEAPSSAEGVDNKDRAP